MNESTPNPPVGAMMTYSIGTAPAAGAKYVITITNGAGQKVRTIELADQTVGLHRVNWNLRGDAGAAPAGRQGGGNFGGRAGGPAVDPGRYTAQLAKVVGDTTTPVGKPQQVQVVALPPIVK
jgi:hypothetical protein